MFGKVNRLCTNFRRHISIDGWDIILPFLKNKRPPYWKSTSFSILTICPKSAYYSASGYRTLSKSKHPLRKYDVISISQDGSRDGWILLPVSYLLMSLPSESQSLLANQILLRYLKWRLRYIFMTIQNGLGRGQIFFKIKNVSISYDGLLHFMNIQECIFDACRLSLHNSAPCHCTIHTWSSY